MIIHYILYPHPNNNSEKETNDNSLYKESDSRPAAYSIMEITKLIAVPVVVKIKSGEIFVETN